VGLISELQEVGKILQKIGQLELYQRFLPLMDEIIKIKEQNIELQEENTKLKKQLEIKESLIFKNNSYYIGDEKGDIKDGPFCSCCWDDNAKLIRLHEDKRYTGTTFRWCPVCRKGKKK
jgi:hypothetical protein